MGFRAFVVALLALGCTDYAPLDVAQVDLERFQGGWYEITKLPRATERDCTSTTATYRLKSRTELDVFNECREGAFDGPVRRVAARAVVTDESEPGKLSLDFGGVFGDFWIIDLDRDYRHAAIGHPSRDYLWILSRTPTMNESELLAVIERVRDKGFDTSRLERTPQSAEGDVAPPSASSLPSPSDHGCSLGRSSAPSTSGCAWLTLLVLGVIRTLFRHDRVDVA